MLKNVVFILCDARKDQMLQVVSKTCDFLSKEVAKVGAKQITNLFRVMYPRAVFCLNCINAITPSSDDSGQVEKIKVFVPKFKPKLPGFLVPKGFTSKEPFYEFGL